MCRNEKEWVLTSEQQSYFYAFMQFVTGNFFSWNQKQKQIYVCISRESQFYCFKAS